MFEDNTEKGYLRKRLCRPGWDVTEKENVNVRHKRNISLAKESIVEGSYCKRKDAEKTGKITAVLPDMEIKPIIAQPWNHFAVLNFYLKKTLSMSVSQSSPCVRSKYRLKLQAGIHTVW